MSPLTQGLNHLSFDLPSVLPAPVRPAEALVVFMDDRSRTRLGQPVQGPWDRTLHLRLIRELFARQAKGVVFDLLLDEAWVDKTVDEQMAAEIRSRGNVVLGASCEYSGGDGKPIIGRLRKAVEPLGSAARWGVAELPLDADGTIRRHYDDEAYTNLAWQAAAMIGVGPTNPIKAGWINYYGPGKTIPHVSYFQVLEPGELPSEMISNKVVFVGMASIITYQGSKSTDEFHTPYTRWTGASSPGVEIQATAFLNLLREEWISRLPLPMELGLIVITPLLLGFVLPVLRPGIALGAGVGCSVAVGAIAFALSRFLHWWFGWGVISFVEVPAVLLWMALVPIPQISRPKSSTKEPSVGETLPQVPDHELLRPFDKGSYGKVWLARNILGTLRAVKIVFRREFTSDKPFEREFRGIEVFEPISRSHEGFVDILQVGRREQEGYFYYVMELADDQNPGLSINPEVYLPRTLASELKRRERIPCEECVQIGLRLAEALQKLHEANLVHQDIKPSNIIFVGGVPKLADIGLVARKEEAGSFVGTEGFIPPEGPGTPQADIFSLGKVLYEIAMGRDRLAFPELPTLLNENPEREELLALNEILIRACRPNAIRRYSSADKMHADLKRLANKLKSRKNRAG
jgi:CHASE2 domain-containing sensor protein